MNFAHLHLLLNHFPVLGAMIGVALFVISFFGKNEDLRRSSLIVFVAMALLAIPTFLSGVAAQQPLLQNPSVSAALIQRHEGSAILSFWFMEFTGALALIGLWRNYRAPGTARWTVWAVLCFSLLTVGLMARTGNTGGDINHPEIREGQGNTVTDGTLGSILHVFEPSPEKVSLAMTFSTLWWGCMMALHFIGLALFAATVGVLAARIMGFAKELPMAPLHRLVPWAMAGLAINIVTGMMAFIGQTRNYVYNPAFWLKMLALLLFGLTVGGFYLSGSFKQIEQLKAGEDAPVSAKVIAACALLLCLALITLGRYIQPIGESFSLR
jgi:uncharacterized membrane protein